MCWARVLGAEVGGQAGQGRAQGQEAQEPNELLVLPGAIYLFIHLFVL